MKRFRHFAIFALALTTCTVSAFAHIPRDVLEPAVSLSDIYAHSSACASTTADRRLFVVLVPVPSRSTRVQYHNGTSNFVDRVYTLDAHGNTTAMEINAGLLPQLTPQVMRLKQNAADELTTIQTKANPGVQGWTDKTPVHDAEGNLTSDGDSTFIYDYENRLVSVSSGSDSATYYYAGDGLRVAAVTVESGSTNTTVFVLDHADPLRRPLAELDENGALVRRFVWGRGVVAQIEASGAVHYFHHDGQGSTLALSDTNNVPTDQWFYSPYGEVMARTGSTDTPYQWCGGVGVRHLSVGGLYFARHRYYHAGLHRWIARDPAGMAGGANLYTYANNNPLLFIDPWGLCADQLWFDRLGNWAASGSASLQQTMIETYPWQVAGALNTVIQVGQGIVSTPQTIGHLGEGAGTFAGDPSWETAPGLFMDISTAAGVMAAGMSALPSARAPIGSPRAYRYVSEGEANVAARSGRVPNVTRAGDPKNVHYSPQVYRTTAAAEDALQIGARNPTGATASPTHRITVDASGANWSSGGNVAGGAGAELITSESLPIIRINRIR